MVKIKKNVETIRNQCSSFITPPAHHTSDPAVGWLPPLGLVETEVYSEIMLVKTFQV